jgi:hypothetical protein
LICKALAAPSQIFTVAFAVNLVRHQHWLGFADDSGGSQLSRSVAIHRLARAWANGHKEPDRTHTILAESFLR